MVTIRRFVTLILVLSTASAWGAGLLDDFNRPNGDLGNDWSTQADGSITVQIVDGEVLIAGTQGTDWARSGLSRAVEDETQISFDFLADDSFNVHIRIDDADTGAYIDTYAWPGGPFSYAASLDGGWPGWTAIEGSNMLAGEYNNLMLRQNGTEFSVILNEVLVGTIMNEALTNIGNVLIASDAAAETAGSLHIDNVMIGVVQAEKAKDPIPADGSFHEDTWVTLSWGAGAYAVSHDVYLGVDYDAVDDATHDSEEFRGNQGADFYIAGFPGYAYPEGLIPGTTYYWRIDEVNDTNPDSPWKGNVWSFTVPPKTAYGPDPADGAGVSGTSVTLRWTPGFGAKLHTVYFGDDYDQVNDAPMGVPTGTPFYNPGDLENEKVYFWRVDQFDGFETYKGEIWAFTTPGAISNPQPANGAVDVGMTATLSWTAADNAASHEVYFGLDKDALKIADTSSPEYQGSASLGAETFDPGLLDLDTTYYWRVDEVYSGNPVRGPVWSFTVGDFLGVEDFESYTDDDPNGMAIWQTWIDGFGVADNGAQVGYLFPPYAEQTIVRGGGQAMPLIYTNEAGVSNSEAMKTLADVRDWTIAGVEELSIWTRGIAANAAEPMYVAIGNTAGSPAVVANDDAGVATQTDWRQWRIPLQAFSDQGINLTDVDSIAIGLGAKSGMATVGGTGTMYIDDIRLY